MIGYFDPKDGMPKVPIKICGTKGGKTINALFDTGHSGNVSLPLLELISIDAEISSFSHVKYADGREGIQYLFSINVEIDGIKKDVKAGLIPNPKETEAIVGLELFTPYVVNIDFEKKLIEFNKKMMV